MPWLLNLAYGLLLLAVSPVLLYRIVVLKKYRRGWKQKLLGQLPRFDAGIQRVWFHAVSVGEVIQLRTVVDEMKARCQDCEIVISTTTDTGHSVARKQFPDDVVCFFPLDFSWSVATALDCIQPTLVALVELELWPNFILAAAKRRIPITLINARISERSFRGYRCVKPLMKRLLRRVTQFAVQNETYAGRLKDLGAPAERICVTGSIKFDHIQTNRDNSATLALRRAFGIHDNERVLIAGSTQQPEEQYTLDAWLALRNEFSDLRLILVPRHKERFDEVARLVESRSLPLIRRSRTTQFSESANKHCLDTINDRSVMPAVLLLDTLGELAACWGLADIAFVGGSLTNRGGQNMIEPAGFGAAVLFGPNTQNFRDVVEVLLSNDAARIVHSGEELRENVSELLLNPQLAKQLGSSAQNLVLAQQGATDTTVGLLTGLIDDHFDQMRDGTRRAA